MARLSLCASAICFTGLASAQTQSSQSTFSTDAPYAVIMDHATGTVLFEKDARKAIAPASMTKIMTAEMVFNALRDGRITPETTFKVSEEAWRRGGAKSGSSTMFLDVNSEVAVKDLLRGVIIQSGNDACIVLAEGLAGSETAFADKMTAHAREIGLESATFRNATGWPHPEHKISLMDLAKLATRSIEDYPEFYSIYSERGFTWNGIRQGNRNPLLGKFTGADGLKTGHTESSGYGLVGSAVRGGTRRTIVINGLGSKAARRDESLKLMQAAFDDFKVYKLYTPNQDVGKIDVYMGKTETVSVMTSDAVYSGLHRADRKNIRTE
ncbi:MAG: D-alanyl-D-alanine carboxypeptidase family protein, partial [Maricaulaceae bacterium]